MTALIAFTSCQERNQKLQQSSHARATETELISTKPMLCEKQDKASMSIEYKQSNINGIMAMCHECGQESAADDVISCHFLLTSNLVTSNYSTALNCQTNKQRAEQTKRIYKEQFARIAYFSALNYGTFNRSH